MEKKTHMSEKNIGWINLIGSGLMEIVWAYFMDMSEGFTLLLPSALAIIFLIPSFWMLERAIRVFGIGMTYAVFTGIGIVGTTVVGALALNEPVNIWTAVFLLILLAGIIGLRFCDGRDAENAEAAAAEKDINIIEETESKTGGDEQ